MLEVRASSVVAQLAALRVGELLRFVAEVQLDLAALKIPSRLREYRDRVDRHLLLLVVSGRQREVTAQLLADGADPSRLQPAGARTPTISPRVLPPRIPPHRPRTMRRRGGRLRPRAAAAGSPRGCSLSVPVRASSAPPEPGCSPRPRRTPSQCR